MEESPILSVRLDAKTNTLVDMLCAKKGLNRSEWLRPIVIDAVYKQCAEDMFEQSQIKEAA